MDVKAQRNRNLLIRLLGPDLWLLGPTERKRPSSTGVSLPLKLWSKVKENNMGMKLEEEDIAVDFCRDKLVPI